jgi:hypothetical protein
MNTRMPIPFVAVLFAMASALFAPISAHAAPPVRDYSRLIVGRWEIRTQGFEFRADGTAIMGSPFDKELQFEKGTWSIKGDVLTLNWTQRIPPFDKDKPLGRQIIPIKFINVDLWEWHSPKGPWLATRIDTQ